MTVIVAVPRERAQGERRVALVPDAITRLLKSGVSEVRVETRAGDEASFPDALYSAAGASIAATAQEMQSGANIVVRVQPPTEAELADIPPGTILIGFLAPLGNPQYVQALASRGLTAFSMELVPRITRAQSMDALSSQSNIAGYKAVLMAASALPKFFPMLTTAAGTVPPARALVLGAGVAGLQAIATARRLGAIVSAYDTRAVVKEQVQSLGAEFLEADLGVDASGAGGYATALTEQQLSAQRAFMVQHIGASDVVVTTANVPGRRAPILITAEAIRAMKPGSVIVDLAAENGGNCELTEPGQTVVKEGVTLIGALNLPSSVPLHASQLYARNIGSLLALMVKGGEIALDMNDEILRDSCVAHAGEVTHAASRAALGLAEHTNGTAPPGSESGAQAQSQAGTVKGATA